MTPESDPSIPVVVHLPPDLYDALAERTFLEDYTLDGLIVEAVRALVDPATTCRHCDRPIIYPLPTGEEGSLDPQTPGWADTGDFLPFWCATVDGNHEPPPPHPNRQPLVDTPPPA